MAIFKASYTLTVLLEADSIKHASESVGMTNLGETADAIENGDWIGQFTHTGIVEVQSNKVKKELKAIGNDGKFFEVP